MKKHPALREYGLILLNLGAFLVAIHSWLILSLLLADQLIMPLQLAMIPVGIVLAFLLVKLATHTIFSLRYWLLSTPFQFLLILLVLCIEFFDDTVTLGAVTEVLLYALILSAIAFFLQSFALIRDWIQTRRESKK